MPPDPGDGGAAARATPCLLFATALGTCGIGWRGDAVTRVVLPGRAAVVRRRLVAGIRGIHADADAPAVLVADGVLPPDVGPGGTDGVPPWVAAVVTDLRAALVGEDVDLGRVPVDLGGLTGTARAVYEHVRGIPRGRTSSHGEVAAAVGRPGGARAVGAAMGANPVPLLVPCHRVVGADGRMVGFSGPGGVASKRRLLELEGAAVVAQRSLLD